MATKYSKVTGPLTPARAEVLIGRLTKALVNLQDPNGEFSSIGATGLKNDGKTWSGWDWPQGVALTALYQHSTLDPSSEGPQSSRQTAVDWFDSQWELTEGKGTHKNVNSMATMYCLGSLLQDNNIEDGTGKWLSWVREWSQWVINVMPRTKEGGLQHMVHDKENVGQLWADTLFMTILPLARIGILLDRTEYVQEAAYQILLHIKYLSDPITGFWTHAWQFPDHSTARQSKGHHFARANWARGNAWVAYAIPLFLETAGEVLPDDDPARRMIENQYRKLMDALMDVQDKKTGLWHTLLDDPESYLEVSASAGFAAGVFAGIRMGLLDAPTYLHMAITALVGVISNINPSGEVQNVSGVTPIGADLQYYREVKTTPMPYGQALAIAALTEWEKMMAQEEGPKSAVTPTTPASTSKNNTTNTHNHRYSDLTSPVSPISPATATTGYTATTMSSSDNDNRDDMDIPGTFPEGQGAPPPRTPPAGRPMLPEIHPDTAGDIERSVLAASPDR